MEIVLFSSLADEVSKTHGWLHFESTETTKISKNDDIATFVTDEKLTEKTVRAKFVSIDHKTLTQTYLCSFAALL